MDKRRFLINLSSNFLSAISGLGISFFLTPYIVGTLGKEAYGFFPLANNFVVYAGILTTALNSMSGRYITISLEKQELKDVNVYFNSVLYGNLIFVLFFLIVSLLFCVFIDRILHIPIPLLADVRLLFAFIFTSLVISLASAVFSVAAFALNRFDRLAFNNIVVNLARLILTVTLFYFFKPHIYFLGLITLVTSIYFFCASYRDTKRLLPWLEINRTLFSWKALALLMSAGMWNSVMALSGVINSQLDLLIANKFFNAEGMGILSLTKIIPNSAQLLLSIVVPIFLPEMLKAYANQEMDKLRDNLDFSFQVIFFVVLIPLSIFFAYGEDFFKLWLPAEDSHTLYIISVLTLIPIVVHASIESIYHVFIITNKLKMASFWGIFISISNLILVLVLCRYSSLGIYAIPLAGLVTGLFSHLTFTPLYASYCLKEKFGYFMLKIVKGMLVFIVVLAVALVWKKSTLIAVNSWFTFFLNCLIVGIMSFMTAFILKFDKKTVLYLVKKWRRE
ncbi:hypothetical protein BWD42_07325 [Sphingobacterium sp. CZ-UAM]|uniref:lipopolysaccharide biosynthesis protein n=1 Tax=Sphingobacterium sp. CZ-UAM TaxID=1933868 RepID=UPI0009855114|nr:oligosaccharide flippase family protein [Sphingobacterium sp. CZ-UAM]OOG19706.1 hypothetical protein BWD42_07325 [Sphingobacterium sp. CZ-UAM]